MCAKAGLLHVAKPHVTMLVGHSTQLNLNRSLEKETQKPCEGINFTFKVNMENGSVRRLEPSQGYRPIKQSSTPTLPPKKNTF